MDALSMALKGSEAMEQDSVTTDSYIIGGKKYARVTSVVRFAYPDTFKGIPESKKAFYFARGTGNHKLFEDVENGVDGGYDYDPEVEKFRAGHARFIRETGFKALPGGIELRVKNDDFQYAGTIDRLGTIQNRVVLLDYKSNTVYDKPTSLQLGLYLLCIPGYKFSEVDRRGVAIQSDGKYKMSVRYPDSDENDARYWADKYRKEAAK